MGNTFRQLQVNKIGGIASNSTKTVKANFKGITLTW